MTKIPLFTWLVTLFAGLILPRFVLYFRRLLSQPLLASRVVPAPTSEYRNIEEQAYKIAEQNLREGLERRRLPDGTERLILCAGIRHFREPWARDTGFASYGLVELNELQAAKEALEVFLLTQNETGQFPVKIHSTHFLERYLYSILKREQPVDRPISPRYITAHNTISLDGNALLIIGILNYAFRSGDYAFVRQYWPNLLKALAWLETHVKEEDSLLHQGAFTDWADSIARQGKILYTNVIYWKALLDMAEVAQTCGHPDDRRLLGEKARHVREAINAHFWRPDLGYYVTSQFFDNLSSGGNLLAIAWGLASPEQAHTILDAMRYFGMGTPVPTKAVHRAYPRQFIAIENRLAGIADYHTYFAWLWLGAWHVIALAHMRRLEEARELLYNMSRVIVRDGAVHEVYRPDGHYASTFWYTSESPLTWSAGMFIYAYHVYQRHATS
ncbi:MAG: hypothetical protein Fur0022_40580 [Anaerolineales bacterium]